MPQIGTHSRAHPVDKSFLYLGSLAAGWARPSFSRAYLFRCQSGGLADAARAIFADLLPATCGYAWPCVDWSRSVAGATHYERSDRYYVIPFSAHRSGRYGAQKCEAGALLLPTVTKFCARQSESLAYARMTRIAPPV